MMPRSPRRTALALGTCAGVLAGGALAWLHDGEPSPPGSAAAEVEPLSDDPLPEVARRLRAIEAELTRSTHLPPWAGRYYFGDGLGTNVELALAPEAGFAFTWSGCMGVYGQNHGLVRATGDRVHLAPLREGEDDGRPHLRTELVPVAWGDRRYLVAPERLVAFGNDVRTGALPRPDAGGPFFKRLGDEHREAHGEPVLPPDLAPLLDAPLVRGRVTEVLGPVLDEHSSIHYVRYRMTLDIGFAAGAYVGMELLGEELRQDCSIVDVGEETCVAEVFLFDDDARPAAGWTFARVRPQGRAILW